MLMLPVGLHEAGVVVIATAVGCVLVTVADVVNVHPFASFTTIV
jgi:hypothetical protein